MRLSFLSFASSVVSISFYDLQLGLSAQANIFNGKREREICSIGDPFFELEIRFETFFPI